MKKRLILEIAVAAVLAIAELIVLFVCWGQAAGAQDPDGFMTAVVAVFINLDVWYAVALLIVNGSDGEHSGD